MDPGADGDPAAAGDAGTVRSPSPSLAERVSPPGGLGTTALLAAEAGREALERSAGLEPHEIDLLILCTTTPDQSVPATSSPVADALGLRCGAIDLNAACAGFIYGLVTASAWSSAPASTGSCSSAPRPSPASPTGTDRTNAFLFGDGAGAVVLEAVPGDGCLLGWDLGVDGALQPILYADQSAPT